MLKKNNNNIVNKDSKYYELMRFESPNWFSKLGLALKFSMYEKRGFPNIANWRFITLTYPHNLFLDGGVAYEKLRPRIAKMLYDLRQVYGEFEYMLKCELHEDGFPHWHLILSIKHKIDFSILAKRWNFSKNCIDYERIKPNSEKASIHYLLKYVLKGLSAPEWLMKSTKIYRFVHFSKGFFTNYKPRALNHFDELRRIAAKRKRQEKECLPAKSKPTLEQRLLNNQKYLLLRSVDNVRNQESYRKIKIPLKYGFSQLATFVNHSVFNYYDLKNDKVSKKDYMFKSWFNKDRAKIRNLKFFSFLVANGCIEKKNLPYLRVVNRFLNKDIDFKEYASTRDYTHILRDSFINEEGEEDEIFFDLETLPILTQSNI